VDAHAPDGRLRGTEDVIQAMPMAPDAAVWGALLSGLRLHGDVWCSRRHRAGSWRRPQPRREREGPDEGGQRRQGSRMHEFRLRVLVFLIPLRMGTKQNQYSLNLFPFMVSFVTICVYVYMLQPNNT
jgi:hypothetical protein